ncbi:MAG: beta-1,6-N-acetylglucosaminyltransferase [Pontixanthobacter sp.]
MRNDRGTVSTEVVMIGFVILSHDSPVQLRRLVTTLNRMYDFPPIACHHDFSQSQLDPADYPNVKFVEPSLKTGWGQWSLVEATLLAIRQLYTFADPDWFMLISASDYPVASAQDVRRDLAESDADVLMDYRKVPVSGAAREVPGAAACLAHHGTEGNIRLARIRYLRSILKIPMLRTDGLSRRHGARLKWRIGAFTASFGFRSPTSPFRNGFECYVGSQWFTARRTVAHSILDPSPIARALSRYLRWRVVPDETYFQSLLCNDDRFKIDPDPRRYADWGQGGAHPKWMNRDRIERARAAGAHFARKFRSGAVELDELDARLNASR